SGLCVDALEGAPGLYSARYAGASARDADNRAKLLHALSSMIVSDRRARFVCILVLLRRPDDPLPLIVQADWPGRIAPTERGEGGFGYDPIFLPDDADGLTAAELTPERKRALSHRGQAVGQLRRALGLLAN